jgi:hypothetical protein
VTPESVTPHNLDAEKSVLGGIMVWPERFPDVAAVINSGDYWRDGHRILFAAMQRLHHRGDPIELLSLKTELDRSGALDAVGGPAYIASLTDGVPRSINLPYYARLVKDTAIVRSALQVLKATETALLQNPTSIYNGLPKKHLDAWNAHVIEARGTGGGGLPADALADAVDVAAEGRRIADEGVQYVVDGLIPAYGGLGMNVAFTKVGKTTFSDAMFAAVAMGRLFLDRATDQRRVLALRPEDPPAYTAWLARHLDVTPGVMTYYRGPLLLDDRGLKQVIQTVRDGHYGAVHIASWQAVTRGLIDNENDNAAAVAITENAKAAARESGVPWLIDAHAGKGENQDDGADPLMALRGASGAAGAADYMLSLRYNNGAFGTQRRLSGRGRFVTLPAMTLDYDASTSTYTVLGSPKDVNHETTWRLICEVGALDATPRSATEIGRLIGRVDDGQKAGGNSRKHIAEVLRRRPEVFRQDGIRRGQKTALFSLGPEP